MRPYQNGMRTLTPERVQLVRALYDAGLASQEHLARQCNVSAKTMRNIVKRLTYRDIEDRPALLEDFAGKVVLEVKLP